MTQNRCDGFSLIELVIVMVIIAVGVLGIASQLGNNTTSLSTNETLQQATQYAQECAERVLATRRNNDGFDSFLAFDSPAPPATATTNTFSCGTAPTGFTYTTTPPTPVVGLKYLGGGSGACPSGVVCRDVNITVTSTTPGLTALYSSITLLLVDY